MSGSFNPFAADSSTSSALCYLHNGQHMENADQVAQSIRTMENRGQDLYTILKRERFAERIWPLNDVISKNEILLPSNPGGVVPKKALLLSNKKTGILLTTLNLQHLSLVRREEASEQSTLFHYSYRRNIPRSEKQYNATT